MTSGEWWRLAACQDVEPELFFPISATNASARDVARAKEVCGACMVRGECLGYALQNRQEQGIWGGMTEEERKLARRRMAATGDRATAVLL